MLQYVADRFSSVRIDNYYALSQLYVNSKHIIGTIQTSNKEFRNITLEHSTNDNINDHNLQSRLRRSESRTTSEMQNKAVLEAMKRHTILCTSHAAAFVGILLIPIMILHAT